MGYIPSPGGQITLVAYLTAKGREYLVNGQPDDFLPRFFAVSDPDTNYLQAAETTPQGPNILPAGYVPDLSGDYSGSIRSLAAGVVQRSFLVGGVSQLGTKGTLGTSISTIGFGPSRTGNARITTAGSAPLSVSIQVPVTITSGIAQGGEQVKLYLVPVTKGTSPQLYPYLSLGNGGLVSWSAGESLTKSLTVTLNMSQLPAGITPGSSYYFYLMAVPFKSSVTVPVATGLFTGEVVFGDAPIPLVVQPSTISYLS
jgi:hypothetical protein